MTSVVTAMTSVVCYVIARSDSDAAHGESVIARSVSDAAISSMRALCSQLPFLLHAGDCFAALAMTG